MTTQANAPALRGDLRWMDPAVAYVRRYLPLRAVARDIASAVDKARRELLQELQRLKGQMQALPASDQAQLRASGRRTDFDETVRRFAWFLVHGLIEQPVIARDREQGGAWSPAALAIIERKARARLNGLLRDQGLGSISETQKKRLLEYGMTPMRHHGTRATKMPSAVESWIRVLVEGDRELAPLLQKVSPAQEARLLPLARVLKISVRYQLPDVPVDPALQRELQQLAAKKKLDARQMRRFEQLRTQLLSKLRRSGPQSESLWAQVDDNGRLDTNRNRRPGLYRESYIWKVVAVSSQTSSGGTLQGYRWEVFVGLDQAAP